MSNTLLNEKFIRLGSYENKRLAKKIAVEVAKIAKERDLRNLESGETLVLFIISEYEKHRRKYMV